MFLLFGFSPVCARTVCLSLKSRYAGACQSVIEFLEILNLFRSIVVTTRSRF